jgi:hypothetical protein
MASGVTTPPDTIPQPVITSTIEKLSSELAALLASCARGAEDRERILALFISTVHRKVRSIDQAAHATAHPIPDTDSPSVTKTLSTEELAQQIVALEAGCPPPDEKAILADARWLQERWGQAELAPYRGTHVAVLNGQIVGQAPNSLQLQLDLARKFNVHPQRLVIAYVDPIL